LLPGNDEIGVYYRSASTQIQRIDAIRRSTQLAIEKAIRGDRASDFRKGRRIYAEVHFYFICWHAIHERIKLVKLRSGFTLSRIYRKHRLRFANYSTARDHLEHYLERLPGGRGIFEAQVATGFGQSHRREILNWWRPMGCLSEEPTANFRP